MTWHEGSHLIRTVYGAVETDYKVLQTTNVGGGGGMTPMLMLIIIMYLFTLPLSSLVDETPIAHFAVVGTCSTNTTPRMVSA